MPELLCSDASLQHAGTTDDDVQVDLEIACGSVNTSRLERALLNAEFEPTHSGSGAGPQKAPRLDHREVRAAGRSRGSACRGGDVEQFAEVNISGLAGFLLAKCATARSRRKPKDWYDIAFVLLHNNAGGPEDAAQAVLDRFSDELGTVRTSLDDLLANFATPGTQGPPAYAEQMTIDHSELDRTVLLADAVIAVETFYTRLVMP